MREFLIVFGVALFWAYFFGFLFFYKNFNLDKEPEFRHIMWSYFLLTVYLTARTLIYPEFGYSFLESLAVAIFFWLIIRFFWIKWQALSRSH